MKYDEFHSPVSADFAPRDRVCEWCGKLAERQLTAIGGPYHNRSGVFCHSCGEQFLACVRRGALTEKQELGMRKHVLAG
jgi:hypothetical protein